MKGSFVISFLLLALLFQQGESTVTRTLVEKILEAVNNVTGVIANEANEYLLEKLKNETQIKEWSVNIQVGVITGVVELVFSAIDRIKNTTDVKILDCIVDEEPALLEALRQAASDNGWCNNRLAANLTRAFQDVTRHAVDRNNEFKKDLEEFKSCTSGDDTCFTKYMEEIADYIKTEFGDGDTMEQALKEVVAIYKIMFGQDVPACNEEYLLPEIFDGVHTAAQNIFNCMNSTFRRLD